MGNFDGSNFNIHGLWPSGSSSDDCATPESCQSIPYDNSKFSTQTNQQLDVSWVGVYNSVKSFRTHEWTKHGTCWNEPDFALIAKGDLPKNLRSLEFGLIESADTFQEDYFKMVLRQHTTYNIIKALKTAGITPSTTKGYATTDILNALGDAFGADDVTKSIGIDCVKSGGKQYLVEVRMCLDTNYKVVDCPCATAIIGSEQCSKKDTVLIKPFTK